MFYAFLNYLWGNKLVSTFGFYILTSAILKATSDIDICIPCIWKSLFGFECPGCGLTSALISLIKLDFRNAIESNWIIFVIVPVGLYYLAKDFSKFKAGFKS